MDNVKARIPIEEAISAAGLKKKFVAKKLGINETYYNEYIRKASSISITNALIICELTGRNIDELDFGQDEKN